MGGSDLSVGDPEPRLDSPGPTSSDVAPVTASASSDRAPRDAWLDALRSVSITRVLVLHTFARYGEATVVSMSFVLPGMPIVFAVSGAVCYAALSNRESQGPVIPRFYRDRARRLLIPFWTYAAIVLALLGYEAVNSDHAWHHYDFSSCWRWLLPVVEPTASEAWKHLALHLWFMPPFVWLLLLAPALVALHRRVPGLGLGVALLAASFVELNRIDAPGALRNVLVYAIAFQAGFLLRDPRIRTPSVLVLLLAAVTGGAFGIWLHGRLEPERMLNAAPLPHVLFGIAMIPLWIAARKWVVALFTWKPAAYLSHVVNRRAYTLFLWGPAANEIAWRAALRVDESSFDAVYLAVSLVGILLFAIVLGRVEIASRR